ncbi:MAG: ADP-ribosylglycohydrolase family protein, partial [Planctomycetota bacterium]
IDITINIASQQEWEVPFNNMYCNFTRDGLPTRTPIDEIVERIAKIARTAILENGGRMELRNDKPVYIINCDF